MMPPMAAIASMFSPARVEPTLTEAHTRLVAASACGMAANRLASIVRHALLDMRREAADEIDVEVVRRAVERFGEPQQMLRPRASGDQRDRRHRDPVVDDRQAEFLGNLGADPPQICAPPRSIFS